MRLTKIYTKTGDKGTTRLANGTAVPKNSIRVEAYGDVDELNSLLGLALTETISEPVKDILIRTQHRLFDLGGELASAGSITGLIEEEAVRELETAIDGLNGGLEPLKEFILPGGSRSSAALHLARTVCRRAERRMIDLNEAEKLADQLIPYINRLSDLLFVAARVENHQRGNEEVYWKNPRAKK